MHANAGVERINCARSRLYSDQAPNARAMALGAHGTVFVGSTGVGDGMAGKVRVIASGLKLPLGVAFHDGNLYVSAVSRILMSRAIEQHLDDPPKPVVVTDQLPGELHHGGKFLGFGPDGRLYVAIGAPCNICDQGPDHGKIIRMNPDGSDWQDVARGVRNSVGFDWQAGSRHLWFTDNGCDLLGDDVPSDELNEVTHPGQHFGYPYCHQGDVLDPEFGKGKSCSNYTPPVVKLGAPVASLGMRFYTGKQFPAAYDGAILVLNMARGIARRNRVTG